MNHHSSTIPKTIRIGYPGFLLQMGLPSGRVLSIDEDSLGLLWLGTDNGLVRYNGTSFVSYKPVPGDSTSVGNLVTGSLLSFSNTQVLAGGVVGRMNGFDIFDVRTENVSRMTSKKGEQFDGGASVFHRSTSHPTSVWLGLLGENLKSRFGLFDLETRILTPTLEHIEDVLDQRDAILSVEEDTSGYMWMTYSSTDRGLPGISRFSLANDSVAHYFEGVDAGHIYKDRSDNIWVGTPGEIQ